MQVVLSIISVYLVEKHAPPDIYLRLEFKKFSLIIWYIDCNDYVIFIFVCTRVYLIHC